MNRYRGSASVVIVGILAVIALIGILTLSSTFTVVDTGSRGVKIRFGAVDPNPIAPGWTMKIPFADQIVEIDVRNVRQSGKTECLSSDLQSLQTQFTVLYSVNPAKVVYLYTEWNGDPYNSIVLPITVESIQQITSGHTAESIVKNRDKIKNDSLSLIQAKLKDTGVVVITDIIIEDIQLSRELAEAIEKKMVYQQQSLQMQFVADRTAKENEIKIATAKAEATAMIEMATAEATAIQVKTEALAKGKDLVQLEIARKWNGVSPTTVVLNGASDGSTPSFILPLDQKAK